MFSIFQKIFGGFLLGILLLSSLILYFSYQTIESDYHENLELQLDNLNHIVILKVKELVQQKDYKKLDSIVNVMDDQINTRITIIAPDGVVLADSRHNTATMENHSDRPEIIKAMNGNSGRSLRYSSTLKSEMLYQALPVYNEKKQIIAVSRVSLLSEKVYNLINKITQRIFNTTVIVFLFSIIGIWFFSRSLTNPIKKLAQASKKVATGDFSTFVDMNNKDEIGDLALNFNYMVKRIETLFTEVTASKEQMDNLINSLQEGFVVLDSEGVILYNNREFEDILEANYVKGQNFEDIISEKTLLKFFRKMVNKKGSRIKEIDLPDKYLLCSGKYIESNDEIIILLHDITDIKELEKIKRDIVANVSHELRTPLTAIKGFIETLEDEVDDKARYYVSIVKRHTDRLINIVKDLLVLSEIEEAGTKLVLKDVNFNDILENVTKIYEPKIKEKNLSFECHIEKDFPILKLDMFKIEQVMINLFDNAIKYTDTGSISINVSKVNGEALIEVEDTGIGIPSDDRKRIFERFYTVDKSRSRKLGGTGLGLSIVKHIILAHNGKITLKSMPGKGTKFIIRLPVIT